MTAPHEPTGPQRTAITAPLGPLLVLAGPGAGKTFCLIERIRYLIEEHDAEPARICAVTFTNKAAEEIAERLTRTLGGRAGAVKRGTLHALCAELLREAGQAIGVPRGFGIADEAYQREVLRKLGVFPDQRRGPLLASFGRHRASGTPLSHRDLGIYARYRAHLDHRELLDFDDLVIRAEELLTKDAEAAALLAGRWDHLLVDEFQDLTPRQYGVVRRLAEVHRSVFGVGDDEQSVFSWTGADPKVLREFLNDFGISQKIVLDENRRTARAIFETARRLLEHNPPLFAEKRLRAERESEYPVRALGFGDEDHEARWLLDDLREDQLRSALPWGEYAVLYRTHEVGNRLESELTGAGIPCRLAAGHALQDDPVVRYLVAALRVIADPGDALRQEAFVRVVLPEPLWASVASEAERRRESPLQWMRTMARQLGRGSEDARKLFRADYALQNLAALASRHDALPALIEELLSQRVGEYRTALEDFQDELSDPAADPSLVSLAERLAPALHGRLPVILPRMGGLELALSGLLRQAGITSVRYADVPGPEGVRLSPSDGGDFGLAFGLFKALQLVATAALRDGFRDFVAVDIETNEFDPSRSEVIDLAAVRVRDGEPVAEFQRLVRPRRPITPESYAIHKISMEMVRDAAGFEQVWEEFLAFCGHDILVAHNGNGFDFPILRRVAADHGLETGFVGFDSLLLARDLHPGSRKLGDLAQSFGIEVHDAHRALGDSRALARVIPRLQAEKLARARKTACAHLLDYLGLALALSDGPRHREAESLVKLAMSFALGRYSDCLEHYRLEREAPGADSAPSLDQVIQRLGGRQRLLQLRREKRADERYPAAMARLRKLLAACRPGSLDEQLQQLLERIALSRSDVAEQDAELPSRVNLLTLHSTKGLEFSRVYIVGVEDGELNRVDREGRGPSEGELQETRRLLYVGMTRAKDRLVLTRSERRRGMPTGGYRFLTEMGLAPEHPEAALTPG